MRKIALTGGIACGKSLLSRFLNELGVETLDADDVVHELLPDPAERRRIAAEVFSNPEKRRELEAKIHPVVKARIESFFDMGSHASRASHAPRAQPAPLKIAVVPLLFEVQWERNFDIICAVVSSRENQLARMTATRGMTCAEAESRLAAQLPVEEKARRSHYVIRNDGTSEELRAAARRFIDWLGGR